MQMANFTKRLRTLSPQVVQEIRPDFSLAVTRRISRWKLIAQADYLKEFSVLIFKQAITPISSGVCTFRYERNDFSECVRTPMNMHMNILKIFMDLYSSKYIYPGLYFDIKHILWLTTPYILPIPNYLSHTKINKQNNRLYIYRLIKMILLLYFSIITFSEVINVPVIQISKKEKDYRQAAYSVIIRINDCNHQTP